MDFDNLLQRKIMSKADKMGSARQVFREHGLLPQRPSCRRGVSRNGSSRRHLPGRRRVQKLWRRYDPEEKGLIDYDHFVRRVTPRHDPTKSVFSRAVRPDAMSGGAEHEWRENTTTVVASSTPSLTDL